MDEIMKNKILWETYKENLFSLDDYISKYEHLTYCGHSKCGNLVTNASIVYAYKWYQSLAGIARY